MTEAALKFIEDFLAQLKRALQGEDPALVQDALSDAEEHLRSAAEQSPDQSEENVVASALEDYGTPEEVAEAYRGMARAAISRSPISPPPEAREVEDAPKRHWASAPDQPFHVRFFGVMSDPQAYSSLFYMLFALFTGIIYFVVVVTGLSISLGMMVLIIGFPLFLLFIAVVRTFSFIEGKIVEALLGVRMPRRTLFVHSTESWLQRIKDVLTDARTWSTMFYMVLQLGLGIAYFITAVVGMSVSISLALSPLSFLFAPMFGGGVYFDIDPWEIGSMPLIFLAEHSALAVLLMTVTGILGVVLMMHLARFVGRMHGRLAKNLLVKS